MESPGESLTSIGPPRRIWKEVYNKGRKETDPLSYFMRVGETGKDLREQQPHLSVLWDERQIPEGDKVIWLDPAKNELEAEQNAEYDKNVELFRAEIDDLNKRENPLIKSLEKLLLPKISHLGPEVFMRWGEKDKSERYILARNNRINGFLLNRMTDSGMIPVLNKSSTKYLFRLRANSKSPTLIFSIEQNPEKNPLREEHFDLITSLINQLKYFIYTYETPNGSGHSIILKRRNLETMDLIDPNSESWEQNLKQMSIESRDFIQELLARAKVEHVELIPCVRQSRGNCFLWSLFFALNIEKEPAHALKMIDDVLTKVGLPITHETRDNVLLELMYGFLERPVPASSVNEAEFTTGLGKSKYKKMTKCSRCGLSKLKGKAMPENLDFLQQIAKQSYNLVDPQKEINGWMLKKWNSTMKFYVKGNNVIVGVRGTKANAPDGNYDLTADSTVPFNGIPGTTRYKRDRAAMQQFQQDYPPDEYAYYAVGHSLGGAIIDSLIRDGFIKEATSYNPAIQYSDINAGLPNRRIYYGSDPLYRLMGWWDRKSEHREPENRTWADWLGSVSPAAAAVAALPAHGLSNFQGGKRGKK